MFLTCLFILFCSLILFNDLGSPQNSHILPNVMQRKISNKEQIWEQKRQREKRKNITEYLNISLNLFINWMIKFTKKGKLYFLICYSLLESNQYGRLLSFTTNFRTKNISIFKYILEFIDKLNNQFYKKSKDVFL